MEKAGQHILLLGAGFSRNWGGWLAPEAFEYLLGHPKIDGSIRDILWQTRDTGFEAALSKLQELNQRDGRLERMLSALADMYSHMENAFEGITFNIKNEFKENSIVDFLGKFDAIFTLNQDLLLERFYVHDVGPGPNRPPLFDSCHIPGIEMIPGSQGTFNGIGTFVPTNAPFSQRPGTQTYFKLHGSANWKTDLGGQILILGGRKEQTISRTPLLEWYSEEFKKRLSTGNTRLMVIGYSFGDDHINRLLRAAVKYSELKFFVVDPLGANVIDKRLLQRDVAVYQPDILVTELWPGLIGASRRDLRSIFSTDRVEYQKLMRFFSPNN